MNNLSLIAGWFLLMSINTACTEDQIRGKYRGLWADTFWEIHIRSGQRFTYSTEGHFAGSLSTDGFFKISGDTLYLTTTDTTGPLVLANDEFIIIGDTCLIELETGYDYCNNRIENWCSNRWDLINLVKIDSCFSLAKDMFD